MFAGSAALSAAARRRGLGAVAVDWKGNAHARDVQGDVLNIDLREAAGQEFVLRLIGADTVRWVHFAPPCGTASRARELPVGPPPLRDARRPWGLPGLVGADAARVQAANALYAFTVRAATACAQQGKFYTIENPDRS